jgi:deoxyadenosine/deoxycytidine kinase
MSKSKRLLNKKPVILFIYGPIAVGKLTVAEILSKKLGFKLLHNHHINDFVREIFTHGSPESSLMKEELRYYVLEMVAKSKINAVVTHCYSDNFISATGLTDPKYVETLERKFNKYGVKFYAIHLRASDEELLKRVSMNSRRRFHKLVDKKIMKSYTTRSGNKHQTSPKLKNNYVIDNTKIKTNKVAEMIIKHYKLK